MKLAHDLREATFVARLNRFAALMRINGREVTAHVPNSGRLTELLRPENPMLLAPVPNNGNRRTAYDLSLVDVAGVLVSADARVPNTVVREAVEEGRMPELGGYETIAREVVYHGSRLDLLLSGNFGMSYVEVKSVTLVDNALGLFPDAPTDRGRRHLAALERAVQEGHRAAVVFVIQRPDAGAFSPNESADPLFCHALRRAVNHGVEAHAYRCEVSRTDIRVEDAVPVRLGRTSD